MFTRIIAFILVALLGYFGPFPVFLAGAIIYIMFWPGYELLLITACIDAQFGQGGALFGFLYTGSVGTVVLLAVVCKPFIRFYNFNT